MDEFRSLETLSKFRDLSGSIYLRIPPDFIKHLEIEKGEITIARIRSEVNKDGLPYCSIWKDGN